MYFDIAVVLLAAIWATWHYYKISDLERSKHIEVFHCCACEQFAKKCEALESGIDPKVKFYEKESHIQ